MSAIPHGTPSLINREARRRHLEDRDRGEAIAAPVVLVAARDALEGEVPDNAAKMAQAAREHGWRVRLTYALAVLPNGAPCSSIALRVTHVERGHMGYAIWTDGKADGAQMRGHGQWRVMTVTDFGSELRDEPKRVTARGLCPNTFCGAEVRLKADGAPYAHKWAGSPCPGRALVIS